MVPSPTSSLLHSPFHHSNLLVVHPSTSEKLPALDSNDEIIQFKMPRTLQLHELLVANTPGNMTAVCNPDLQRARRTSSRSSTAAKQQQDDRQSYGPVHPPRDAASRPEPISPPPIRSLLDMAPIPEGCPSQQAPATRDSTRVDGFMFWSAEPWSRLPSQGPSHSMAREPLQRKSDWTVQSTSWWVQSESASSSKVVTRPPTPGLSTLNQPMPTVPPRSARFRKCSAPQPANPPREDLPYNPRGASEPASQPRYQDFPYGRGWS